MIPGVDCIQAQGAHCHQYVIIIVVHSSLSGGVSARRMKHAEEAACQLRWVSCDQQFPCGASSSMPLLVTLHHCSESEKDLPVPEMKRFGEPFKASAPYEPGP
jgi:hypothetical protein